MTMKIAVFALLIVGAAATESLMAKAELQAASKGTANPIRRVVTMLQMMVKKVEAEGLKEKELFEKFMCYCKSSKETLAKSIEEASVKIPQLESDIKEAEEELAQLQEDLKNHKADRAEAT